MIGKQTLHDKFFDELHDIVMKEIEDRKLSSKDLADLCGVSPAYISQLTRPGDRQKRFLPSLVRVADILNINLSLTRV